MEKINLENSIKVRLTGRFAKIGDEVIINVSLDNKFFNFRVKSEFAPLCSSKAEILIKKSSVKLYQEMEIALIQYGENTYTWEIAGEFSDWKYVTSSATLNDLQKIFA
jgi:hypothetical protein